MRFRNPGEDVPQDFGRRREEYYAAFGQPVDTQAFVAMLRRKLEAPLAAFDADLLALTPLLWAHMNPYGTFTLSMGERLPLEQAA